MRERNCSVGAMSCPAASVRRFDRSDRAALERAQQTAKNEHPGIKKMIRKLARKVRHPTMSFADDRAAPLVLDTIRRLLEYDTRRTA